MSSSHFLAGIPIPYGMIWIDEHSWVPAQKSVGYSCEGALMIDVGIKQAGRSITLQADDNAGWIALSVLNQVQALAADAEAIYRLVLADGREFDVQFAPGDDAIVAKRIGRPALPAPTWDFVATFKFITV